MEVDWGQIFILDFEGQEGFSGLSGLFRFNRILILRIGSAAFAKRPWQAKEATPGIESNSLTGRNWLILLVKTILYLHCPF